MDNSTKKSLGAYLFSAVGIAIVALGLLALNWIVDGWNLRVDCTEENLYTLSDGTKEILGAMDTEVTVRFYFSRGVAQMPVFLKSYAERVEDLLDEYKRCADGKITIMRLDPEPDSDAEDSARMDGVAGQGIDALGLGERIYFGLAISCLDQTEAIAFLSPDRETLLEYDVTRAIYRVTNPDKPKLAIMSSLPVMGRQSPMMMPTQPQQNMPPWLFVRELKQDYDVSELPPTSDSIPDDVDVLLCIHAKDLSEKTLYAIDQFVLGGGKLMAFLDPMSFVDQQSQQNPQMRFMPPAASSLGVLLDTWGVRFDGEKIAVDLESMIRVRRREGAGPEPMPTFLGLQADNLAPDDPVTAKLESLLYVNGGAFSGTPSGSLTKTVLLQTSANSQLTEKFAAQRDGAEIIKEFESGEMPLELAIRLTGTFTTAFPDGPPSTDAGAEGDGESDDSADEPPTGLTASAGPGAVVLVGDSDLLYDAFCVQRGNLLGQEIIQPINDNLNLALNLLEQLSGDANLIGIRSRGALSRPFEVVREMQAEAEQRYKSRIKALEDELQDLQNRISEMQREKSTDQRAFLSAEQREAIERFRQKEAETNQELKQVRRALRRDINFLQNALMVTNIGLMPALVIIGGIVLAAAKRRRTMRK